VEKIIVGILSGRGKELMDVRGREVDSAYFIPNLRIWFNENLLCPFLGGDTLLKPNNEKGNLIQSMNLILPYVAPHFIKDTNKEKIYDLSMTCLENARDIMKTIEKEYQKIYERTLTLGRLGEITISPRFPYKGSNMHYDYNKKTSLYIENDIEELKRLRKIIK